MEELKTAINEITADDIIKIVVSNKLNKDVEYNKITFLLKDNTKKQYYQIEKYTDKQVFHENINKEEIESKLLEMVANNYKQLSAWS